MSYCLARQKATPLSCPSPASSTPAAAAAEEGGGAEEEDGYRWDSFCFLSLIDLILRILVKKKKLIALDGAPSL